MRRRSSWGMDRRGPGPKPRPQDVLFAFIIVLVLVGAVVGALDLIVEALIGGGQ